MEESAEEGDFPHVPEAEKSTLTRQVVLWFRIDGLLDRSLTAAKQMVGLIMKMENHTPRGPRDYEAQNPQPYVVYSGHVGPPAREPSWQKYALGIVAVVVGLGIPSIGGILWSMNMKLEQQAGQANLTNQRLDQQERHLESTDRHVDAIERELWPHKH